MKGGNTFAALFLLTAAFLWAACAGRARRIEAAWPADPAASHIASPPEDAPLCAGSTPELTQDSAGPLFVGMTLVELRRRCAQVVYSWRMLEGTPEPVVVTRVGDVVLVAELDDTAASGRVFRLWTRSAAARTAEGVGPGVPVLRVGEEWGDLELLTGEGRVYAKSRARDRFSFGVAVTGAAANDSLGKAIAARDWHILPRSAVISEVFVLGLR